MEETTVLYVLYSGDSGERPFLTAVETFLSFFLCLPFSSPVPCLAPTDCSSQEKKEKGRGRDERTDGWMALASLIETGGSFTLIISYSR